MERHKKVEKWIKSRYENARVYPAPTPINHASISAFEVRIPKVGKVWINTGRDSKGEGQHFVAYELPETKFDGNGDV